VQKRLSWQVTLPQPLTSCLLAAVCNSMNLEPVNLGKTKTNLIKAETSEMLAEGTILKLLITTS
jgi:hypothetical protein